MVIALVALHFLLVFVSFVLFVLFVFLHDLIHWVYVLGQHFIFGVRFAFFEGGERFVVVTDVDVFVIACPKPLNLRSFL